LATMKPKEAPCLSDNMILTTICGLLRDGGRIRVPMMMRDSADGLTDLQRSVRDHFAPARVVDTPSR
jgi:hypothetical protein